MMQPFSYAQAFNMADAAIQHETRCGKWFPEGVARTAALAALEGLTEDEAIDRLCTSVERAMYDDPFSDPCDPFYPQVP